MGRDISALYQKIINGDRAALGQAMTLLESELHEDREDAVQLLSLSQKHNKRPGKSIRIAISGAPGVGKSTLIEVIGLKAIADGYRVGVLTIDPTSSISRGSILGDKSRMQGLSVSPSAFVRSSAAGSVLGGISRRSFEMMALLEAIHYDIILLETVGVGQSEHTAWQITDGFILVIQPGSGDDLQVIKRGVTELADIIVINKSDGALQKVATITLSHFQNALHYLTPNRQGWERKVLTSSALEENGTDEFWHVLRLYLDSRLKTNEIGADRSSQSQFWLSWSLSMTAHSLLMNHPRIQQKLKEGSEKIINDKTSVFSMEFEIEELMKELISTSGLPPN
jgi:LAO/AO transport system kinase